MKNANNYAVDFMNNTIIVSKAFYKKATSSIENPEYTELKTLIADYPEYKIKLREIKKKEGKRTNRNLTYSNMKKYIIESSANAKADLAEFEKVQKTSCVFPSPYVYVKDWFTKKYPAYGKWLEQLAKEKEQKAKESKEQIAPIEETAENEEQEGSAA